MSIANSVYVLHKYFIWADRMRVHFDTVLKNKEKYIDEHSFDIEANFYISYWYAGMYVVIEGWKELALSDDKIDTLLDSPSIDKLRRLDAIGTAYSTFKRIILMSDS